MSNARCYQSISLGAWHALRHFFQLFDLEEATDVRADVAILDDRRTFRHRFVSAVEKHWQDADARVQREVTDDGFEVSHDARHRARAFREDQRVVATIEERFRMSQ